MEAEEALNGSVGVPRIVGELIPLPDLARRPVFSSSDIRFDHVDATKLALMGSGGRGSLGGLVGGGVLPRAVGDARPLGYGEALTDADVGAEDASCGLILRLSGLLRLFEEPELGDASCANVPGDREEDGVKGE